MKMTAAIQLYCQKCKKEGCAACPLEKYKTGTNIPTRLTFQKFCYQCMTEQGLMVERCQKYSCPLYPYSVKKSRRRMIKDLESIISGKPTPQQEAVIPNHTGTEEDVNDEILEGVTKLR